MANNEFPQSSRSGSFGFVLAALMVAVALLGGGWLLQKGLYHFRAADRYVTVRGLDSRDVKADLAVWPIRCSATHNDLQTARAQLEHDGKAILAFLARQGFQPEEISVLNIESQDLLAQTYRPEGVSSGRYLLTQTFLVRTHEVDKVGEGTKNITQLFAENVVLTNSAAPTYLFTKLNDIKPEMVAAATRSAREAANQFAVDTGQKVGAIRSASQGYFEIKARDPVNDIPESAQRDKTVRVVTTVEYYLE